MAICQRRNSESYYQLKIFLQTFMKVLTSLFFFILYSLNIYAQPHVVHGRVLAGDKGLAQVIVTDGYTCVGTDKNGFYQLSVNEQAAFIYISAPSGFHVHDSAGIPKFYQKYTRSTSLYNFKLSKNKTNDLKHVLLVHTDPQFHKAANFVQYKKIIADTKKTVADYKDFEVFGIDCGDLVGDKPDLYAHYIDHLSQTGVPFYRVKGNHDMNYGGRSHVTSTKTYNALFGPAYYSFNKGKVHYVVLDNVFYLGRDYFYMGYLAEEMLRWLEQDLAHVDKGATVFVAMHIPARLTPHAAQFKYDAESIAHQTVNTASLFKMLEPYNAHILTGHMHYNKNMIHSPTLYEHNTGAISGTWWQGDYCLDGTPIGYGVYEIEGNNVKWYYKTVGKDRTHQFRLYPVGKLKEFPESFSVNIWNWDKDWKVEWWENGQYKGAMNPATATDPAVAEMCADKEKLEFSWIAPITTDHIFTAIPKDKNAAIKVVVTDRFGNKFRQEL